MLHDLCKAQFYKVSTRNVKNEETGQWEKKPFYSVEDAFPYDETQDQLRAISEIKADMENGDNINPGRLNQMINLIEAIKHFVGRLRNCKTVFF